MLYTHIRKNKIVLALFLISFTLRANYLSPWLEDWDSVQFAMALENFDLAAHLPHPPGYPLYILLARVLNQISHTPTISLTLLSAVLGSLGVTIFYLFAKKLTSSTTALLASLAFSFTPIYWILSNVALSNIPGIFFTLLTAILLFVAQSNSTLFLASFLAGFTLGVRFAEYSILLPLLAFVLLKSKPNLQKIFRTGVYFSLGLLSWLIPLVLDTSLPKFIDLYTHQVGYIASHDSVINQSLSSRIPQIYALSVNAFTLPLIAFFALAIAAFFISFKFIKKYEVQFLLIWTLGYLIPLVFIYNLEVPRHILPLLPPALLLSVYTIHQRSRVAINLFLAILSYLLFQSSFPLVKAQANTTPPSILPTIFVEHTLDQGEATLITTFTFRQFEYYLPTYPNYWGPQKAPKNINTPYIVTDYSKTFEQLNLNEDYSYLNTIEFTGPKEIFPRLPKTTLFLYQKTHK